MTSETDPKGHGALNKDPAYLALQPGDPWTFIQDCGEFNTIVHEDGQPVKPGDHVTKWFDTSEPGRVFRVTAVHPNAVETLYVGFAVPTPAEVSE